MSNSPQRTSKAPSPALAVNPTDSKRRRFLLALGAGGASAAAVAAQSLAAPVVPAVAEVDGPKGYRETDHIRDYYATTRF